MTESGRLLVHAGQIVQRMLRRTEIHQQEIRIPSLRLDDAVRGHGFVEAMALMGKDVAEEPTDLWLIFDQEDRAVMTHTV